MKTVKNITSGIAVMLCIFICIYVLTLYLKFKPDEPEMLEDGTMEELPGKLEQFLDANINTKEHLDLIFLLAISAAAGFLLEKLPSFGMLTSACALVYALTMYRFDALPKFPNSIILLCMVHTAGAVFYAATSERGRHSFLGMESAAAGGLLCNAAALGVTGYVCSILKSFSGAAEKLELLADEGIVISTKLASIPDVIDMVWRVFERRGAYEARSFLNSVSKQYEAEGIIEDMQMTYVPEELSVYLRLGIILFGIMILALVFRRRAWVGALLSLIPPVYIFGNLMLDKLSTASLVLLTLTLLGAIGAFAAYQREGEPALIDANGEELELEDEDDPLPEELPRTDGEDDAEGDAIEDSECEGLDYFYERPKPETETLAPEERDEYLEITESGDGDQKDDREQE